MSLGARAAAFALALGSIACQPPVGTGTDGGTDAGPSPDASGLDSGSAADSGADAGTPSDAGLPDAGGPDAGAPLSCPGTTYYLSPDGGDLDGGGTVDNPWQHFAYAIPRLRPGDCLLLEDGTYDRATTGLPSVNCADAGNAENGTASAPISLAAASERRALIQGDGHSAAFNMQNCSYWRVEGLHVEDQDADPGNSYNTMNFANDSYLVVRRNIAAHSNRCQNAHLFAFNYNDTHNLIEENEAYFFIRHSFILYSNSNFNEVRRNYANHRGYAPTCPGYNPGPVSTGGMNYGASDNLWENNFSEGNEDGLNNETIGSAPILGGTPAGNNRMIGNVSLGDVIGNRSEPHTSGAAIHDLTWQDEVIVSPKAVGLESRSSTHTVVDRLSVFAPAGLNSYVTADQGLEPMADGGTTLPDGGPALLGTGIDSLFVTNSIVIGDGGTGYVVTTSPGTWTFSLDGVGAFGARNLSNQPVSNTFSADPAFGNCYLWAPAGSPVHGAALDGGTLGATVLYASEDGGLTGKRLWDPVTGAPLFAGAVVPGLNDPGADGGSLLDIAGKLNIGQNGCPFPPGY